MPLFSLLFFLKNSCYPGLAFHTAQLSTQTGDYLGQGSSQPNSSQPVTIVSGRLLFDTSSLFPQRLQASRSILVLLKSCLAGEGAISQESCGRSHRRWAWGCSHPGPCVGPRDLMVPKHSPYHLIFQCPLYFWPLIFIYAGKPLAVHSVPQKIS